MNTPSNAIPESPVESQVLAPAIIPATRRMYWCVRRELWEYRSIYIAPLAAAAVFLFGFLIGLTLSPAHRHEPLDMPYELAAALIMGTAFLVGIFYSLDALYGERRDRSILFWKSLPVSDLTTVLSKAAIPLVVLPLIGFALSVATQLILLLWSTVVLIGSGMSPAPLWAELRLLEMPVTEVYGIGVFTLWHAPMYGWLLLVSGWARRTPVLWAMLPMVVVSVVERITFNTSHFSSLMRYRFMGSMTAA